MGGLSRRAYAIKQQSGQQKDNPVLVLDAGALLFDRHSLAPSQLAAKKIQAEGIMQAMSAMQYSAIGVSSYDLAAGSEFLEHMQKKYQVPFVSMNLVRKPDGKPVFTPYILKQLGDASVAVLGLSDISAASSQHGDLSALSWQETLPQIVDEAAGKAEMIILLSSFPEQINREIANRFKNINLILQSAGSTANRAPKLTGNTLIAQTASQGKYVGMIDIAWNPEGKWRQEAFSGEYKDIKDRLDRVNWRLNRMEKQSSPRNLEENSQYVELQKTGSELLAELEKLSRQEQQAAQGLSTYRGTFIALLTSFPEDPEVQAIINANKTAVYEINKKSLDEFRQKNVQTERAASMAGWKACLSCHPDQTGNWHETAHARAWETLAAVKQQLNQDCLICHVTLPTYDRETVIRENLIISLSPEFHGVSCESCHGPGKKHVDAPEKNKLRRPSEETCITCHTPDQDDNFDFARKLKILGCPTAGK
ncbi:MAG: UshA-like (seleno)protein [Desulfobulbaceae bacterium]|nr:UshA-like (seleno)protein [Desulfobulbaceae bacterium]